MASGCLTHNQPDCFCSPHVTPRKLANAWPYYERLERDPARDGAILWPIILSVALFAFVAGVYLGAHIPKVWP